MQATRTTPAARRRTGRRALVAGGAAFALAACADGAPTSPDPLPLPSAAVGGATTGLTVDVASLALAPGTSAVVTSSTQYAGTHYAASSDPAACTVTPSAMPAVVDPATGRKEVAFTVTGAAPGTCAVTITDRRGNSAVVAVTVEARVLGSLSSPVYLVGARTVASSVDLVIGACAFDAGFCLPGPAMATIFAGTLTEDDVGRTIAITSTTTPDFAAVAGYLTNGVSDQVAISMSVPGAAGAIGVGPEATSFTPICGAVDFAGCTITGFALEIEELTIASPGEDPYGDGIWTEFTLRFTLRVLGY